MKEALVIVSADPRSSTRALEALRLGVGLTLAENRVRILFEGEARRLLEPEREAFPDYRRAREYLTVLEKRGVALLSVGDPAAEGRAADCVIRWDG